MTFQSFKLFLIQLSGLDKDALHIYIGMAIFLTCLTIFRKIGFHRYGFALVITTCFALLGEVFDIHDNITTLNKIGLNASIHDIINTCLLPYVLYGISKWTRIFELNK